MISLLEKDIVDKHKWLTKEEFVDLLAISQSLPGIMAVNVAISVGNKLTGLKGSIMAALGTILPSFLIILFIAMFLTPDTIKNNETLTRKNFFIPLAIALLIWSDWPIVSSPVLFIILGGVVGYFYYSRNYRKLADKN